jgi:hypothetical protein
MLVKPAAAAYYVDRNDYEGDICQVLRIYKRFGHARY